MSRRINDIVIYLQRQELMQKGVEAEAHSGRSYIKDLTRVIFYVRRIGLYLYKYRIYGTISIYILKGLAFVYQLI